METNNAAINPNTIEVTVNEIAIVIAIPEDRIIRVENSLYTFSEGVYYCLSEYISDWSPSYYEMKNGEWHRNHSPLIRQLFAPPCEIVVEIIGY